MKVGDLVKRKDSYCFTDRPPPKGILLSFNEVGDPIVWWFSLLQEQKSTATFRWSVEVLSEC